MNITDMENRLLATENALNSALKEIERLKATQNAQRTRYTLTLRDKISDQVFDSLFDVDCNKETGEICHATDARKYARFHNLTAHIFMCAGFFKSYKREEKNIWSVRELPLKEITDEDFEMLQNLMKDVCDVIYKYNMEK